MKQPYTITGMTCSSCAAAVKQLLTQVKEVSGVEISVTDQKAIVDMKAPISIHIFQEALQSNPRYQLTEWKPLSGAPSFWNDTNIWKRAAKNTLTCLIGCSIGDFGMIIYLQHYYHHINMYAMMGMAMLAGLATSVWLETLILKVNEAFPWKRAFNTAIGMSFLSMLAMELAENSTDLLLTGGKLTTADPFYWYAFGISLLAGFVVPLPYNYFKLKKYGKACH